MFFIYNYKKIKSPCNLINRETLILQLVVQNAIKIYSINKLETIKWTSITISKWLPFIALNFAIHHPR